MPGDNSYWQRRTSRRRVLQAAGLSGAGLVAAAVIGCGDDDEEATATSSPTPAPATGATTPTTPAAAQPKRGGTLVHLGSVTGMFPQGFDPHTAAVGPETGPMALFYQHLVRANARTWDVEAELAQRWEQPSETEYIFTLSQGVKWHNKPPANGRELTADDIVFSLKRIGTDDPRFVNKSLIAGLDKIEAVDKSRVRITTKTPDATTLASLTHTSALMVAPEVVEGHDKLTTADLAIGTGPFMITEFNDTSATLVRNQDYWKQGLPYLEGIRLAHIPDAQAQWSAFLAGQIDVVTVPGQEVAKVLAEKKFFGDWFKDIAMQYIWPNTQKSPFSDPRLYRALRLLIDSDEFISGWVEVWFGPGSGGYNSHLPHALDTWDFNQDEYRSGTAPENLQWKQPKNEAIKEALSLLSAAGFTKDNPLSFTLHTIDIPYIKPATQLLLDQYQRFSQGAVKAEIKIVDNAAMSSLFAKGEFEFAGPFGRTNDTEPDQHLRSVYHSKGGRNFGKWNDPAFDQMLDKQRSIFNTAQRKAAVKDILKYLMANAPYVATTWRDQMTGAQAKVRGLAPETPNSIPGYQYETVWLG